MDKSKLLARRVDTDTREVPIGDLGAVTVRGLARAEVKAAKEHGDDADFENRLIAAALVDPVLTPDEVAQWLDNAPAGDSVAVMDAIQDLSGMSTGAPKSGVSAVRKRSRSRI